LRHPSLVKQQAAAKRKHRGRPKPKQSISYKGTSPSTSPVRSFGFANKLIVKSVVAIVIVAICLWVRDHPLSIPSKITDPIVSLASSSFSFASLQEQWGPYIGFNQTSSEPVVYTSDLLYAAPVLSLETTNMTKQGDQLMITANKGENVYATESGIVLFIGQQLTDKKIVIQHADKKQTIYENVSPTQLRPFDHVSRGETIGTVRDDSGFIFSIRDDHGFLDPSSLFLDHEE